MVQLDIFLIPYGILVFLLVALALFSVRKSYTGMQKRGACIIMAAALVNVASFLVFLSRGERETEIRYALSFFFTTWGAAEVFWYTAELADLPFIKKKVLYFVTWLAVGIDGLILSLNFVTSNAFVMERYLWNGRQRFTYIVLPSFHFHLFLCYLFAAGAIAVCIFKIFSISKVYRRPYYEMIIIIAMIIVCEIYYDYIAKGQSLNLTAAIFVVLALWTYWNAFLSAPGYQSYLDHFLIDRLEAGLVMFNYDDKLQSFNKRASDWFGLNDGMKGQLWRDDFIRGYDIPVSSDEENQKFKFSYKEDYIDGRFEVIREDNRITGYLFVFYSITSEEKSRRNLEKYSDNRNTFIVNMTHELRTPLNAIIGFSGQLMENMQKGDCKDQISLINKSGRLILRYLNEMTDMMSLSDGEYVLNKVDFRPQDVMNIVIDKSFDFDRNSRVIFEYNIDPMTPTVLYGDRESVITVIDAILDNAVNFTERGRIGLNVTWHPGDIKSGVMEVVVTDTGCGMSEEILENIYLAFSVGQEIRHKHENGIGIGLYIAKKILDLMGGSIAVESHMDIGTTVTVKIPFSVVDSTPVATTQKKESLNNYEMICNNANILVVEDDPINARTMRHQLEHFKAHVHTCESGESALEYLATGMSVDMIFMDYRMPGIDGIEATERIRSSAVAIRNVPIIAVSADAAAGRREQFLAARMNDVMFKPFELAEIADIIARWLSPEKLILTMKSERESNV